MDGLLVPVPAVEEADQAVQAAEVERGEQAGRGGGEEERHRAAQQRPDAPRPDEVVAGLGSVGAGEVGGAHARVGAAHARRHGALQPGQEPGVHRAGSGDVSLDTPPADILDALRSGQKITAIKLWRERTGLGLAEAKNEIDDLERRLGL